MLVLLLRSCASDGATTAADTSTHAGVVDDATAGAHRDFQ